MVDRRKNKIWEWWVSGQNAETPEPKISSYFDRNIPHGFSRGDRDPIQFIMLSCDRKRKR